MMRCRQSHAQTHRDLKNGNPLRDFLHLLGLTQRCGAHTTNPCAGALKRNPPSRSILLLPGAAAILYDSWQHAAEAELNMVRKAFETNTLGAWRMCQAFIPLLRKSRHGRIVNVSSESGSLSVMGGGTPTHSVSKAALNALTRMLADELRSSGVLVNSVCPGWVATDMGGPDAPRTVKEGAASVLWAATLADAGPTGDSSATASRSRGKSLANTYSSTRLP